MKELYRKALKIAVDIEQTERTIKELEGVEHCTHLAIGARESIGGSYCNANIRVATYITFLQGEKEDLKKSLKAVESKIKDSL